MRIPDTVAAQGRNTRGICGGGALLVLLFAMLLVLTGSARAQAPAGTRTILRQRRALDVRTGQVRSNQAVAIEGEQHVQIRSSSEVKSAAVDTTIDLPEAPQLPGLIDMH